MSGAGLFKLRRPFFFGLAFAIIWGSAAQAKSIELDDSGTEALDPLVSMHWRSAAPSRSGNDDELVGTTTIRVRVNVMAWLKRSGRIYLSLPAQPPGPLRASWVAQGRFLSGQITSGNRVLVYAGPITTPFLEDVLKFRFSVDGRLVRRAFPVNLHFEMDES